MAPLGDKENIYVPLDRLEGMVGTEIGASPPTSIGPTRILRLLRR